MYLQTASGVDELLTYGIVPAIEFLDMAEDLHLKGHEEKAKMLRLEAKGKLFTMREVIERILEKTAAQ